MVGVVHTNDVEYEGNHGALVWPRTAFLYMLNIARLRDDH